MKEILMATDLSKRSEPALQRAVALAKKFKAHLTVMHVVDEGLPEKMAREQRKNAEQHIRIQLADIPDTDNMRISQRVEIGEDYIEVMRLCQKLEPDLVVLGMHRKTSSVKDFFLGTTVERVVRYNNSPVLIVKEPCTDDYGTIITSTDFSISSRRAIEICMRMFPNAHYELLHVYDIPFSSFLETIADEKAIEENRKMMLQTIAEEEKTFLQGLKIPNHKWRLVILKHSVARHIVEECEKSKAELLVIGTHGRTGVANELLGSVAAELVQNPPCDILVAKSW